MLKKYFKVWLIFAINSFQTQLNLRWTMLVFLIGKMIRFAMFAFFVFILLSNTKALAGYNLNETLLFYLSFNLVDMLSQLIFREVYRFRYAVVTGTFDFYLIKPYNPLFRALTSGPDLIDLVTLVPLLGAIVYLFNQLPQITALSIFVYIFLIFTALIIATSFHILVLSLAILTTEIDSAILMYRDIAGMGRFPVDIYKEPFRSVLTFLIPVGIMMSFPVKAVLGILSVTNIAYSLIFSITLFYFSLLVWNFALRRYSSASS
ncbi:ABC-2 family transporter protein [Candidatus Daviesbacteria bacterium]|nr:ABC-2 family transporter protein [Candidatus Daviesbacteria bacterium]